MYVYIYIYTPLNVSMSLSLYIYIYRFLSLLMSPSSVSLLTIPSLPSFLSHIFGVCAQHNRATLSETQEAAGEQS